MDTSFKRTLKAKAHHLNPVVLIGAKGLTPAVIEEINVALLAHELIKIKIHGAEKKERQTFAEDICQQLHADLIGVIGHVAIVYRKKKKSK